MKDFENIMTMVQVSEMALTCHGVFLPNKKDFILMRLFLYKK